VKCNSKRSPPETTNKEGQQYTLRDDGGFDVINYDEFSGWAAVIVLARGVAYQENPSDKVAVTNKTFLLDSFFRSSLSSSVLQCPVSFDVEVHKACFNVLGKKFRPIDISGTVNFQSFAQTQTCGY
jgi:hypothetical protein